MTTAYGERPGMEWADERDEQWFTCKCGHDVEKADETTTCSECGRRGCYVSTKCVTCGKDLEHHESERDPFDLFRCVDCAPKRYESRREDRHPL